MSHVARYGRMTAKPGRGEELARLMLAAAFEHHEDAQRFPAKTSG